MAAGIMEGMGMVGIDIGICAAGFMVTSWLDNELCWQYNQEFAARIAGMHSHANLLSDADSLAIKRNETGARSRKLEAAAKRLHGTIRQ